MRLIVITLIFAFSTCSALAADAARPLNLLVITADDMNADSGGWNGNTLGATPNLDAFAKTAHPIGSTYVQHRSLLERTPSLVCTGSL